MNRCGERRCIAIVHLVKIFQDRTHGDSGYSYIHHLINRSRAEHLHAQQLMALPVSNQLRDKIRRSRIVMCFIIGYRQNGFHVIALIPGSFFREPSAAAIQSRELHDTSSKDTRIVLFLSCKHLCQHTPFQVSAGAHG